MPKRKRHEITSRVSPRTMGKWIPKKDNDSDHTLLYVGAGWDMSFPMFKTNVLIDQRPKFPYEDEKRNGYGTAEHLKEPIATQLGLMFPNDLKFEEDVPRNRWCWSSAEHDVTIIYYHSTRIVLADSDPEFKTQTLPAEVQDTDVLYVRGCFPYRIGQLDPNLRFFQTPKKHWKPQKEMQTAPAALLPVCKSRSQALLHVCHQIRHSWWKKARIAANHQTT